MKSGTQVKILYDEAQRIGFDRGVFVMKSPHMPTAAILAVNPKHPETVVVRMDRIEAL